MEELKRKKNVEKLAGEAQETPVNVPKALTLDCIAKKKTQIRHPKNRHTSHLALEIP